MKKYLLESVRQHVIDCTAVAIASQPVYCLLETTYGGLSNNVSMNARMLALGLVYTGFGSLYSRGRDVSRKTLKIAEKTNKFASLIHDASYAVAFNLVLNPLFYYAAGARDPQELFNSTISGCIGALLVGIPVGYSIEAYRDFTGLQKSDRLPEWITQQNPYVKTAMGVLCAGLSAGALSTIYYFNR